MLTFQIGVVFFIIDGGEARIEFGGSVGTFCNRNQGFAVFFGEQVYGRITKSHYFDCPSVSRIDRGRFAAGDHTAILFNEYSAFPMLSTTETVGRSSVCHFGFCSA